jgi:hypothetical protein
VRYALAHHGLDDTRVARVFKTLRLADFAELPDLARGLRYAVRQVHPPAASAGDIQAKLSAVAPLREDGMATLRKLVRLKVVKPEVYEAIARGSGSPDVAEDAVAIAEVLEAVTPAERAKGMMTDEEIALMRELGEWLLDHLTPAGARKDAAPVASAETRDRDAMAALLRERYQTLRGVAYVFHSEAMDEFVPPLLSAQYAAPAADEGDGTATPPAAPAAAPAG